MMNKIWINCSVFVLLFVFITSCEQEKYIVAFETGGSPFIKDMEVSPGTKLLTLPEPIRENHTFGGWYVDSECKYRFDNYTRSINSNITLYADLIEIPPDPEDPIYNQKNLQSILESTALMPYLECTIETTINRCTTTTYQKKVQYNRIDKKIFFEKSNGEEFYYFNGSEADMAYSYFKDDKGITYKYKYYCSLDYLYRLSGLNQILQFSIEGAFSTIPRITLSNDNKTFEIQDDSKFYTIKIDTKDGKQVLSMVEFRDTDTKITWNFSYNTKAINPPSGHDFSSFHQINARRVILAYPSKTNSSYPTVSQFTFYSTPKGGFFRLRQEEADRFSPNFTIPYKYSRYNTEERDTVFSECKDYLVEYENSSMLYAYE